MERKVQLCVTVDKAQVDRIKSIENANVSQIVRSAVDQYLISIGK